MYNTHNFFSSAHRRFSDLPDHMANDSERSAGKHLTTSLTRRELLGKTTALGLGFAADLASRLHARAADNIPYSLSDTFTTHAEEIHAGFVTVSLDAVTDEKGVTSAVYSLLNDGTMRKIVYSSQLGKYELSEQPAVVPIDVHSSIVGFANYGSQGNELLVVGGHNTSADHYTKYATLAISRDSGGSYEPFPLRNEKGEKVEGIIREMKRIPFNNKVLFRIGHERSVIHQFGIYDIQTNKFSLVSGEFEELPLLDDLYVHPDNPSALLGCGRIVRKDEQGEPYIAAINDFILDIDNAVIHSSITHHESLPYLDDVQVIRDEDGRPKEIYALQSLSDAKFTYARNVYKLDPDNPEAEPFGFDYGALDYWLVAAMDKSTYWNQEYIKQGVSVFLKHIRTFPHGTWVTGFYQTFSSQRPFAAYWQPDEKSFPDNKTLRVYPFDKILTFPSVVAEQPKSIIFRKGNSLGKTTDGKIYGWYLDLQAAGGAIIQTNQDKSPHDGPVLHEKQIR